MTNKYIFTDWERDYIDAHDLTVEDFYDARGESKAKYYQNAKKKSCGFVIHNYCNFNHRLKDRHGHCIVCHPEHIAFQKRSYSGGAIYIATCNDYCKIGVVDNRTGDIDWTINNRTHSLNAGGGYGGLSKWNIVKVYPVEKDLGTLENSIHTSLKPFEKKSEYYHNGTVSTTKELFKCSLEEATTAVECVLPKNAKFSLATT